MLRWAWRLFLREWRQQLLILALVVVAVGATVVGAAVSTNTPPSRTAGFGTAEDLAAFVGSDPHLASDIAELHHRFGAVDVIENQSLTIPGSINTYDLRSQNPHGAYGGPMLSLLSGSYPTNASEVAMTPDLLSDFGLDVGDLWHEGGTTRRIVGTVQNPQSLLDEFALVIPGQVTNPTQVTVLFDAPGLKPSSIGPNVETPASVAASNAVNPESITLALVTLGMLLIALVAIGGFTVLAQRRLRSIGMLESIGATDRQVRFVLRGNGLIVGLVGAVLGAAAGIVLWLASRSQIEADAHHVIPPFALPWVVVGVGMALAVVATYVAASRPARAITRVPVVAALSGRPAPPRQIHRSVLPGLLFLAAAFILLTFSSSNGGAKPRIPELIGGLVALIPAIILLSPFCLSALARVGRRAPVAVRVALRDLARYRARSGATLAAISLGVLIAVVVSLAAAARYGNVLDYAGPNLASNQMIVYTAAGPYGQNGPAAGPTPPQKGLSAESAEAHSIARALGSHQVVELLSTSATLQHAAAGRNYSGPLYVATPALLHAFGIRSSQVEGGADVLSMRPGFSGISDMQLVYGNYGAKSTNAGAYPCPKSDCLPNPVIQEIGALPSGTSAPNTVITEHAVLTLGLHTFVSGWFIVTPVPPTAMQITNARLSAAQAGMTIETKSSAPSSSEIINWATVFGILLALGILAMSVGLIRSETAGELRTLAATGAGGLTRRVITAATASALGFLGAVLGTAAGYVGVVAILQNNKLNGGIGALGNVPLANLVLLIVVMPLVAGIVGFAFGGREQPAIAHQPIE